MEDQQYNYLIQTPKIGSKAHNITRNKKPSSYRKIKIVKHCLNKIKNYILVIRPFLKEMREISMLIRHINIEVEIYNLTKLLPHHRLHIS